MRCPDFACTVLLPVEFCANLIDQFLLLVLHRSEDGNQHRKAVVLHTAKTTHTVPVPRQRNRFKPRYLILCLTRASSSQRGWCCHMLFLTLLARLLEPLVSEPCDSRTLRLRSEFGRPVCYQLDYFALCDAGHPSVRARDARAFLI